MAAWLDEFPAAVKALLSIINQWWTRRSPRKEYLPLSLSLCLEVVLIDKALLGFLILPRRFLLTTIRLPCLSLAVAVLFCFFPDFVTHLTYRLYERLCVFVSISVSRSARQRTPAPNLPRPVKAAVTPVWLDIPQSNTVT